MHTNLGNVIFYELLYLLCSNAVCGCLGNIVTHIAGELLWEGYEQQLNDYILLHYHTHYPLSFKLGLLSNRTTNRIQTTTILHLVLSSLVCVDNNYDIQKWKSHFSVCHCYCEDKTFCVFLVSYIDKLLSTVCHVPENTPYGPYITLVVVPAEKRNQPSQVVGRKLV